MKSDRETRELLLESGKKEFMEKGYMKASLRKICANAGVTTGALYFFFKDKEDLFAAITEPVLNGITDILQKHFAKDIEAASKAYSHTDGDHDDFVAVLVHHIYSNYDACILLLTKSQGTRLESCADTLVDMIEQFYLALSEQISSHSGGRVNRYMLHWLTHMVIDSFIHLITHENDEKTALVHMEKFMEFITSGWQKAVFEDTEHI